MGELDLLIFGAGIAGLGTLVLGAAILELTRKVRAGGRLIGVGLGLGVFAFAAKLVLIAAFGGFGDAYLRRFLPHRPPPAPPVLPRAVAPSEPQGQRWEALPRLAPAPPDNPTTAAKVALGRRLFNDPRLSADGSVACRSCHDLDGGAGADGRSRSVGIGGQPGGRNAPTVLNAAFQSRLFWDGRAASLEEQASGPMLNPREMGMPSAAAVAERLRGLPEYREPFARAFGEGPITLADAARALAAYERTLITPDTPYDRFVRGDATALTPQQLRGMALFAELGCVICHSGPNFSGAALVGGSYPFRTFPAIAGSDYEARYRLSDDRGRAEGAERGVWRIPSLRNVGRTAPYFHNGAVERLEEAVKIMARVQLGRPLDDRPEGRWRAVWEPQRQTTAVLRTATVSDDEVAEIVAFLHALEGDPPAEPE